MARGQHSRIKSTTSAGSAAMKRKFGEFKKREDPPKDVDKVSYMFYGGKGAAKTAVALGAPGIIAAISYDGKTGRVWDKMYGRDERIFLFNVNDRFDYITEESVKKSFAESYNYVFYHLLDGIRDEVKPDWILHDGAEYLHRCCDQMMRTLKNLGTYSGTPVRTVWKKRNDLMSSIYRKSMDIATKGLMFTCYPYMKEIMTEGMQLRSEVPKWVGELETATDNLIKVYRVVTKGRSGEMKVMFKSLIETSKTRLPTGLELDITCTMNKDLVYNLNPISEFWKLEV